MPYLTDLGPVGTFFLLLAWIVFQQRKSNHNPAHTDFVSLTEAVSRLEVKMGAVEERIASLVDAERAEQATLDAVVNKILRLG